MNVFLLAPKYSLLDEPLPDYRAQLAVRLEQYGHVGVVMEREPSRDSESLREKFLRLAGTCEQAILVWPSGAAMGTTADEILLLQEAVERSPIEVVLILSSGEVILRSHELHVLAARDQSRYLDGILQCLPFVFEWPESEPFETILGRYEDAFLNHS